MSDTNEAAERLRGYWTEAGMIQTFGPDLDAALAHERSAGAAPLEPSEWDVALDAVAATGEAQKVALAMQLCLVIEQAGPNLEPLACALKVGHDGNHSWASLPTWADLPRVLALVYGAPDRDGRSAEEQAALIMSKWPPHFVPEGWPLTSFSAGAAPLDVERINPHLLALDLMDRIRAQIPNPPPHEHKYGCGHNGEGIDPEYKRGWTAGRRYDSEQVRAVIAAEYARLSEGTDR